MLSTINRRSIFDDAEFFDVCRRLSELVSQHNLTVLLARMFADLVVAVKEGGLASEDLPINIPEIMLAYLNYLNRSAEPIHFSDRIIQAGAKITSWTCLQRGLQPATVRREDLLKALAHINEGEVLLDYLESGLKLFRTVGVRQDHMISTLDPLTEYLAALYLVERVGMKERAWSDWYEKVPPDAGKRARGFLLALRECWLVSTGDCVSELAVRQIDDLLHKTKNRVGSAELKKRVDDN